MSFDNHEPPLNSPLSSIDAAMHELRCHAQNMWLDMARSDQSDRWRRNLFVSAEDYFARLPELRARREDALVLICGEAGLRRERGEEPSLEQFQSRFPDLADDLALQFELSRILDRPTTELKAKQECLAKEFELPGYEFLEEIGRGATSVVVKARQQSLDRLVAIKIMAIRGTDEKRLSRQRQEADILAHFQHPHVVHIYEVVTDRQFLYLVMEYIDGQTLERRSGERSLPPRDAARLISILAETVHAVHEAGVLHRDLKPSNILLTSAGKPKITDFGLAKLESNSNLLTTQDSILGTPGYMAPEQASGDVQSIGRESDVYSLGAILYELLGGRPPFLGATVLDTLHLIREREPVRLRHLQPNTPRDLETICLKCLNKAPKYRYATAQALADDLQRFLSGANFCSPSGTGGADWTPRQAKTRRLYGRSAYCVTNGRCDHGNLDDESAAPASFRSSLG